MVRDGFGRRALLVGGAGALGAAVTTGLHPSRANALSGAGAFHPDTPGVLMAVEPEDLDIVATVASPTRFAGIDPTGTTDSTAGLQAAMDATPDGSTLLIPAGVYLVAGPLAPKAGKSITVSGYGARLVATSSKSIISLRGDYDETVGVTSIINRSVSFPSGASEVATVLTVSTAVSWVAGDVIKLVADDIIEGSRPGSSRIGEFAVVYSVAGTTVTLVGRVRENYLTNIRAARITRQTIAIVGLDLETTESRLAASNEALLAFNRLYNPKIIDVRVVRAGGQVIRLLSCFGYLAQNVDVAYARDSPGENNLGYGILDNYSSFGRIVGGTFRHVRHAYTDDSPNTTAGNADLGTFGRTYGTVLVGVEAIMTTSASFSTHHSSEGVTFSACRASGGVPGGSSSAGFELRGKAHRVVDCTVNQLTNGVLIRTESGGGESWGHYVSNFRAESVPAAALRFDIHPSGHPSQNTRDVKLNATIDGVTTWETLRMLYTENAVVAISNAIYTAPAGVDGGLYEGVFTRNSEIRARDLVFDYTYNVAGKPRPFITGTTSGRTPGRQDSELTDIEVRATPEAAARAYFAFGGTENLIRGRDIRFTTPFPFMPGESHAESTWHWYADYIGGVARTDLSSAFYFYKSTALEAALPEVLKSSDQRVVINVNAEGKKLTISALPPGRRKGQEWVFVQATSGETTFLNGAAAMTSLKSGANRVLWKGRRLELTWDGALWQEFVGL